MKLFDAHCHLQSTELFPMPGKVMERAAAAGVERMVCCGTSPADWNQVLQLAAEFPQIIPMVGIHPWFVPMIGPEAKRERPRRSDEAATDQGAAIHPWFVGCRAGAVTPPDSEVTDLGYKWKQNIQTLEKLLREHPEMGVGETGLDFSSFAEATADRQEKFTNRAEQEAGFAAHLDLARELNRPVAVHCVHAWERLIEILREHPAPHILLHAFGGAPELIPELVALNCWFSFCGSVTNPKAKRVRASVVAVPEDRLLIETDSPDFPPAGCESPNEPANLIHVVRAIAELRGVLPESLSDLTFANSEHFFSTV